MSAPLMPFSPLDALTNCLHRVRQAGRVRKGDDVISVQQRIADVFLPIVKQIQSDAARKCAGDVCFACARPDEYKLFRTADHHPWKHQHVNGMFQNSECAASNIHERLHRESQKGGNHAKTETQAGAD